MLVWRTQSLREATVFDCPIGGGFTLTSYSVMQRKIRRYFVHESGLSTNNVPMAMVTVWHSSSGCLFMAVEQWVHRWEYTEVMILEEKTSTSVT